MKPATTPVPAFWRRTPPALFPGMLGLFGLGLAWQKAAQVTGLPSGIGDAIVGGASVLYLSALAPFIAKILARPAVLLEDLRVLPARAGVAAASMCLMVMAAGVLRSWPGFAGWLWSIGLLLHALFFVAVLGALVRGPAEQRVFSPVLHLPFVGFIVAPLAGVGLGDIALSAIIYWLSLFFALVIFAGSTIRSLRRPDPAPLRPALAIHLSPVALLGLSAELLDHRSMFVFMVYLSVAVVLFLLLRLPWIIEAGWSPLWGSFTFPLAAFASLMCNAYGAGIGLWTGILAMASLALASIVNPYIAIRTYRSWLRGGLAAATNAATA
ncbi:MAG: tellurium resistance protein [Paracoccaceae bacterium]